MTVEAPEYTRAQASAHAATHTTDRVGDGTGTHIFFRLPDGSIQGGIVGKGGLARLTYMQQGWEPLDQYGSYHQFFRYYSENPYEPLLQRGGAHEMSVKQLREMGYDHSPPKVPTCGLGMNEFGHGGRPKAFEHTRACWKGAQPAHFPQLDGLPMEPPALCDFCDDNLRYPTTKAREQHVRVMHKDELQAARQGKEVAAALANALRGMGMQMNTYACALCSETFADVGQLSTHVALHEQDSESPTPTGGRTRRG